MHLAASRGLPPLAGSLSALVALHLGPMIPSASLPLHATDSHAADVSHVSVSSVHLSSDSSHLQN